MGLFYILEFGGQHTDLISSRLESLGHSVMEVTSDTPYRKMKGASGIILSGGPKSVYDADAYHIDPEILRSPIPVLGICYGFQTIAKSKGARVFPGNREYGGTVQKIIKQHPIFEGMPEESIVWMNHGDSVDGVDEKHVLARTDKNISAIAFGKKKVAVQFHPELTHTEYGTQILRNFAEVICGAKPSALQSTNLDIAVYATNAINEIKSAVGNGTAGVYVSGGVDSTVALQLARKAGVPVTAIHLDMGVERKDEADRVSRLLLDVTGQEISVHNYSDRLIEALKGKTDPEDKRKTFQQLYRQTFDELYQELISEHHERGITFVQGTLATDRRESGKEASKKNGPDMHTVATIKTHHNVQSDDSGRSTVEPLRYLSKDGVRKLARYLGLPESIAGRPPFPGPGLVVRMVTGIHPYEERLARNARDIAGKYDLDGYVLPIKTVGLKGDGRAFEHLALVEGKKNWDAITRAQKLLAEELPISRTVYLHESWTKNGFEPSQFANVTRGLEFNRQNISLLQEATEIAENTFEKNHITYSQMPVVLFPGPSRPLIAIRDVHSVDFRSVRPLKKPEEVPWEVCDNIAHNILRNPVINSYGGVDAVVYDASSKPAATTEWE
ncbi:hypothetical protein EPN87_04070 [archaeon]|nr:MAG: hypothetical protein EPN87_04070 [archaeon]